MIVMLVNSAVYQWNHQRTYYLKKFHLQMM